MLSARHLKGVVQFLHYIKGRGKAKESYEREDVCECFKIEIDFSEEERRRGEDEEDKQTHAG